MALISGFILDFILGDPHWLFHPVRFIGFLIRTFEKILYRQQSFFRGFLLVLIVVFIVTVLTSALIISAYAIHPAAGCTVETIMIYQLIAAKCLKVESMKVYKALKKGSVEEARKAVSMIVGRDTENLTEEEIARAAVETIAENTSDGVIAPLFYIALGGPVLGFIYKTINTFDSMIAYKNQRYINFGRFAAKCDDVLNFIPSRLSALLMIAVSKKRAVRAFKIWRRDRFNHESPNSAQTESVCAGILGLRLAGPHFYEGKLEEKPFIGDDLRPVEAEDIVRANSLMYRTTILMETAIIILCTAAIFTTTQLSWIFQ